MDKISNLFESISIKIKPIGMIFVVAAIVLLFSSVYLSDQLPLGTQFMIIITTMWIFGLALIYLLYNPEVSNTNIIQKKYPIVLQLMSAFLLFWFIFLTFFTVIMLYELTIQ